MLLGPDAQVTPLRPPAADEPTGGQLRKLRAALTSAVSGWDGAGLMAMQLREVGRVVDAVDLTVPSGSVAWRAGHITVVLPPELAASLVCLSLGGPPDDEGGPLTGLDLAVLDIWARPALAAVGRQLKVEPAAPERMASPNEALSAGTWPALVAQVPSAVGDALIIAGLREVMQALADGGRRLGDRPEALDGLRVPIEARMPGVDVPLADLLAAAEGDVLALGTQVDQSVELLVDGSRVALGRPGVRSGTMAIKIDRADDLWRR